MSDLMRDAVISMPLEMAMGDEFSRFQFHDRAQELLKQVHSLEEEHDRLREALKVAIETTYSDKLQSEWIALLRGGKQ